MLGLSVIAITPDQASTQCATQAIIAWSQDLTNHQISISTSGVMASCEHLESTHTRLTYALNLKGAHHVHINP